MGLTRKVYDLSTTTVLALPSAASTTVNGTMIDLGSVPNDVLAENLEVHLSFPALSTTIAPDTRTFIFSIEDSADNSTYAALDPVASKTYTGAGSAGISAVAATAPFQFKLPPNVKRYIRVKCVSGASTTDASALSYTVRLAY